MTYADVHMKAIEMANSARNAKQFNKAIKLLMSNAEHYPRSAYELFKQFRNVDMELACSYLVLAAQNGWDNARIKLAEYLAYGTYFDRNENRALELAGPYADTEPFAANLIGVIYLTGTQVAFDLRKAVAYFTKASAMGFGQASLNIGLICTGRYGVAPDPRKALDWFITSAEQGCGEGCYAAASIYIENDNFPAAHNYLVKGVSLGDRKCAELLPELRRAMGISDNVNSSFRQSSVNESRFSYTGQKDSVEEAYAAEKQRIHTAEADRDALTAAAAQAGGGYIDFEAGVIYTKDGRTIVSDAETHTMFSEDGVSIFDDKSKVLYGTNTLSYFDDDMNSMYDSVRQRITYIYK